MTKIEKYLIAHEGEDVMVRSESGVVYVFYSWCKTRRKHVVGCHEIPDEPEPEDYGNVSEYLYDAEVWGMEWERRERAAVLVV